MFEQRRLNFSGWTFRHAQVVAEVDKGSNRITVSEIGNYVRLYLSSAMLDLNKTVTVVVEGKSVAAKPWVSLKVLVQTLLDRGDPNYVFPACLVLSKNPEVNWMLEQLADVFSRLLGFGC